MPLGPNRNKRMSRTRVTSPIRRDSNGESHIAGLLSSEAFYESEDEFIARLRDEVTLRGRSSFRGLRVA